MADAPAKPTLDERMTGAAKLAIEGYDRLWIAMQDIFPSPLPALIAIRMAQDHLSMRWQDIDTCNAARLPLFVDALVELAISIGRQRPLEHELLTIRSIAAAQSVTHFDISATDGLVLIKSLLEAATSTDAIRATFAMVKLVLEHSTTLTPQMRALFEAFSSDEDPVLETKTRVVEVPS